VKTVLVIEDDAASLRVEQQVLRDAGYDAEWVADGEQAATRSKTTPYVGIVLDVTLAGADGYALAARIGNADANRHTPLVVLGSDEPASRKRAFDAGAMAFLPKPFTAEAFRAVLRSVVSPANPPTIGASRPAARPAVRPPPIRIPLSPPADTPTAARAVSPAAARSAAGPAAAARLEPVAAAEALPVSYQGGAVYWSQPDGEGGWRCGRCEVGTLASDGPGASCGVCQAQVVALVESSGAGLGWLVFLVVLALGGFAAWALFPW
jgi:CheY-like chemotaxis protein